MFVVTVEFRVEKQWAKSFHSVVIQQAASSLEKEEACRQFDVCLAKDEPDNFFLYEVYDDADAFQRHLASDHFLAFDRQVRPWVTDKSVSCWIRS